MATVNIDGDASGAVDAVAEAQAAIDSLTGKTVYNDVVTRGLGDATRGMSDFAGSAGQAQGATRGMGDNLGKAADHVSRMVDDGQRLRDHLAAVDNVLRNGPVGGDGSSSGLRQMADDAGRVHQSISNLGSEGSRSLGAIESGTGRVSRGFQGIESDAGRAMREIGTGAQESREQVSKLGDAVRAASTFAVGSSGRIGGDAGQASRLGFGDQTGQKASTFAVDSAGTVSGRLAGAGAGTEMERFTGSAAGMGSALGGSGKELELFGGRASEMERHVGGASRTIDALGRVVQSVGGSGGSGGGILSGWGDMGSMLGAIPSVAGQAAGAVRMVGMASVYSAAGMGILGAAVAGVGLAGVAEDFAHNSQLMNAGQDAVRGFNKEFSKMRSETSASGMPAMDGLAASMKGVGHEMAAIGAANMAPTLNMASQLAGSTTQAMKQLAPAIGPAERALTALGGAALGALGNSAPEIARFANIVSQNAGGLQSATESIIRGGSALGGGLVQAVSAAAPFLHGAANVAAWGTDLVSGAAGIPSNFSDQPGPDGSLPNSVDTGIPDGMGGTVHKSGSSTLGRIGSGAFKGGVIGAGIGALFGPEGIPIGGAIGAVAGGLGAAAGVSGLTPGTSPLGDWSGGDKMSLGPVQSQKSMGLGSRPGRFGNFGPGSGGPAVPPGPSGAQVYSQQYQNATGSLPGAPAYSGVGPRGAGQSVGAMPASIASGLGLSGGSALPGLMQSMQSAVGSGGGDLGGAAVKHITKAVNQASPAAAAGGASLGGAMTGGMAQGVTTTQTVTDTAIIKHLKKVQEIASGSSGIDAHSPSRKYDALGRLIPQGLAQGIEADSSHVGAMSNMFDQPSFGYQGSNAVTVSLRKRQQSKDDEPQSFEDYQASMQAAAQAKQALGTRQGAYKPGSAEWWGAHDNRAEQLSQARAQRHEIALSNLGVPGHVDPRRGPGDVNPLKGTSADPIAAAGLKAVANPFALLPGVFAQHGENMAQGVGAGIKKGTPSAQSQMTQFASTMQGQHKRDHKINSPSEVFASDGMNMAAGVGVGFAAGTSGAVGAISNAAAQMSSSVAGPLNSQGLQLGYSYATNIVDGATRTLKTANFQDSGTPQISGEQARTALGQLGLLGPGAGASVYKTSTVSMDSEGIAAAVATAVQTAIQSQQLSVTVNLDGQYVDHKIASGQNGLVEILREALFGANG